MKRQAPTEHALADLIASAHEAWAQPDPRRLVAMEQQLLAATRQRHRASYAWWWLVAALATGAASALWWPVNYDSSQEPHQPLVESVAPLEAPASSSRSQSSERSNSLEPKLLDEPARKPGPVIYQREK